MRETLEILQGIWTNEVFEYHGEFADFGPSGFGVKPLQKPYPPIYFSGLKDPKRSANRVAKYDLAGWIGIQHSPDGLKEWRGAIQAELDKMDTTKSMDDLPSPQVAGAIEVEDGPAGPFGQRVRERDDGGSHLVRGGDPIEG